VSRDSIEAAICEQEEHIRRSTSCGGRVGRAHSWDVFSVAPGGPKYEACGRCHVTRTPADYATRAAAAG